ncbi:hypothetical protein CSOJ01_12307 [Colletotrichum sojae]|uniref:Uncharacterized protein n=1 Tax=Colletotrichum sojae TaxID=2175907 RepID=A0A8H6IW46_9PEZI|nr:hypothetical protein CSOJ01_12307 [Colletotrichum sojae]
MAEAEAEVAMALNGFSEAALRESSSSREAWSQNLGMMTGDDGLWSRFSSRASVSRFLLSGLLGTVKWASQANGILLRNQPIV